MKRALAGLGLAAALLSSCAAQGPARIDVLFAGGSYNADQSRMTGQAHVLKLTPRHALHATPLVFVPGQGQTIANFLGTPDGREGWAMDFLRRGFTVYLMDQPGRGASGYDVAYGPAERQGPLVLEQRFTAPETFEAAPGMAYGWPQAVRHSQWPGTGLPGDPAFDQFFASQVGYVSGSVSAVLVAEAGAALLDRIGPAVVVTHSQSGPFGWGIGELRPKLVRAIVAVEPSGPPFASAPRPWGDGDPEAVSKPYGLTVTPLTYEPALNNPADLVRVWEPSENPELTGCWLQGGTPRRLAHLAPAPVLVLTAEASYHAGYDHCTAAYLSQAGVQTEFVRMEDWGLHGNGHMVMLEKNSAAISGRIADWLEAAQRPDGEPVLQ
ncbi:alpha/beta hydrolase [Brevundimonas sp. SL161]|uniref:alpha/beta hydrolase n=1 Tax=Brevundimonas sp. SL161 TaxID=2804613 RepID=UPI003CF0D4AA